MRKGFAMTTHKIHDKLFKRLLTEFFKEFADAFLPKIAPSIEAYTILDLNKELFPELGERVEADMVFQVHMKDKPDELLIVHIEHALLLINLVLFICIHLPSFYCL